MNCRIEESVCLPVVGVVLLVVVAHGITVSPPTKAVSAADTLHGDIVLDPYRWLESGTDPEVMQWSDEQERFARGLLDSLPQRAWLIRRLNEVWRYDDRSTPKEVLEGSRIFYWAQRKGEDRWRYVTQADARADTVEILNPNAWPQEETLDLTAPSRDGSLLAFGKAHGGDEDPAVQIMEVASERILPDSLRGWRRGGVSWLPDKSGFFYSANPRAGEVPEGEEFYWHSVYFHRLGRPASEDRKVFWHDTVKEYFHGAGVTEDGQYVLYYRSRFDKNEVYISRVGEEGSPRPIVTGFDAQYGIDVINGKLFIVTDQDAPRRKLFTAPVDAPGRENWKEFLPETQDNLVSFAGIAGKLYVEYSHNATTRIAIYDLEGTYLRDLPLPGLGSASIDGHWSKPTVWVSFSSFTYPKAIFTYDYVTNELRLFHRSPVPVDVDRFTTEQVWYASKDGTRISMFLIHSKSLVLNGDNPVLLTGYGGFNVSQTPYFSGAYVAWIEAGGMVAIPHLRGGGEYGREWHEAGMLERKQNVFDDFIAAAEWLIREGYTTPARLAIEGGSNGGLLVGAAVVQRPDLFRAVLCEVPLLDMLRYHRFGLANIWAEEYGSADDPAQYRYLRAYSPYHNVADGTCYPAMLFVAGENDARVDPVHARKMVARLQAADPEGGPFLLIVQRESGHGGGTTLSRHIEQRADAWGFLMNQIGMKPGGEYQVGSRQSSNPPRSPFQKGGRHSLAERSEV
ncbi:MAG: prolyl oligopeptidase family serine peptidase [Candidatus Eisenbacteria bacterium]|nr:prolyl oligopeptidase family serine peptidase [Candidatus Eisenbacteria bacterium]